MEISAATLEALFVNYKTIFFNVLSAAKFPWQRLATTVTSTGSKNVYPILGALPGVREWLDERHIKKLGTADLYELTNRLWEATVSVRVVDIEDDQLGVYPPMFQQMANNWELHPMELIGALVAAGNSTVGPDGQHYFDTDHEVQGASVSNWGGGSSNQWCLLDTKKPLRPMIFQDRRKPRLIMLDDPNNVEHVFKTGEVVFGGDARYAVGFGPWQLAYGSKDTLNATNLDAAHDAMIQFKDDEGRTLNIEPDLLIVGPSNRAAARDILNKDYLSGGESNVHKGAYDLMVIPALG